MRSVHEHEMYDPRYTLSLEKIINSMESISRKLQNTPGT